MSDEARAALKWWRDQTLPIPWRNDEWFRMLIELAHAFDSEHPPDEDEPITPEWLATLATSIDMPSYMLAVGSIDVEIIRSYDHCDVRFRDCDQINVWPLPVYTRGQLLRLLKELEQ